MTKIPELGNPETRGVDGDVSGTSRVPRHSDRPSGGSRTPRVQPGPGRDSVNSFLFCRGDKTSKDLNGLSSEDLDGFTPHPGRGEGTGCM